MKIALTNLGKYNEGVLDYVWLTLPATEEEIAEIREKNGLSEDWVWENQKKNGTATLPMTEEQWKAAQAFWDIFRANPTDFSDDAWSAFESAFEGQDDLFEKLNSLMDYVVQSDRGDSWRGIEDLPADWWVNTGSGSGLSSEDISGFKTIPGQMRAAVREGVNGIKVTLDGYTVGNLVAPYVSESIARYID